MIELYWRGHKLTHVEQSTVKDLHPNFITRVESETTMHPTYYVRIEGENGQHKALASDIQVVRGLDTKRRIAFK